MKANSAPLFLPIRRSGEDLAGESGTTGEERKKIFSRAFQFGNFFVRRGKRLHRVGERDGCRVCGQRDDAGGVSGL